MGTKPRASGRGMGSVTPWPPPHSLAALRCPSGRAQWAGAEGKVACCTWGCYVWGGLQYMGCYMWGTRLEGAENVMGAGVVS